MSDFLTIDENLRAAMRFFGEATGSGTIEEPDGVMGMYSGLDYGVFNIGLLTRPVNGDLEIRLKTLGKFFRERTLRWSVWLCQDMLDPETRRKEREIFAEFGMRTISSPPGMIADRLLPPVRPVPAIECRRVNDGATRRAFTELTALSFDIPYTVATAVYSKAQAWNGAYQGFVGYVDGKVVSIVAIVAAAGVLGVYSLATQPQFRRKGYGEALLRAAVAEIGAEKGLSRVILQSTEAGHRLYRTMGFRDATRFSVYLTR